MSNKSLAVYLHHIVALKMKHDKLSAAGLSKLCGGSPSARTIQLWLRDPQHPIGLQSVDKMMQTLDLRIKGALSPPKLVSVEIRVYDVPPEQRAINFNNESKV